MACKSMHGADLHFWLIPHPDHEFPGAEKIKNHVLSMQRRIRGAETTVFLISAPADSVKRIDL